MHSEESQPFFYASPEDAEVYDETIHLTQPGYALLHDTLLNLAIKLLPMHENIRSILDLGCGTGKEAISLLSALPNAELVAIDMSQDMLNIFNSKLDSRMKERVRFLNLDMRTMDPTKVGFRVGRNTDFDLVVTAFAIHHLTSLECEHLYDQVASILAPGGCFINADLFDFRDSLMSQRGHHHLENWILTQLSEDTAEHPHRPIIRNLGSKASDLKNHWIRHVRDENVPLPIERPLSNKPGDDSSGAGHKAMLAKVGFSHIEVPVRVWQGAVMWARKAMS